jgi:hypothetical protein
MGEGNKTSVTGHSKLETQIPLLMTYYLFLTYNL